MKVCFMKGACSRQFRKTEHPTPAFMPLRTIAKNGRMWITPHLPPRTLSPKGARGARHSLRESFERRSEQSVATSADFGEVRPHLAYFPNRSFKNIATTTVM